MEELLTVLAERLAQVLGFITLLLLAVGSALAYYLARDVETARHIAEQESPPAAGPARRTA